VQGDEQEPDMRCGTPGTSGHATTKSSIHRGAYFINPAFMHRWEYDLPRETSCESWKVACHGN
jgi:hypothetical protein